MEACPFCGHRLTESGGRAPRHCPDCGRALPGPDDTMGIGGLDALLGDEADRTPDQTPTAPHPGEPAGPRWQEAGPEQAEEPPPPPVTDDYAGRFPLFADGGRPSPAAPYVEHDERADHERTHIRPIAPSAAGETRAIPRQAPAPSGPSGPPGPPPPPPPAPTARGGAAPAPLPRQPYEGPLPWEVEEEPRRRWPLFVIAALVLALVLAGGGWWLLDRAGDEGDTVARESSATTPTSAPASPSSEASTPSPSASPSRTRSPSASASSAPRPSSLVEGVTIASVPDSAPDSTDVDGETVSFGAENLVDGDPTTAWRMPGSGQGSPIVFRLPKRSTITRVGLVNGYAKAAQDDGESFNWYDRNRRITRVQWVIGKDERVTQRLDSTTEMQTIRVDPVTTRRIKIRIMAVSGVPKDGRDFTAISEVDLTGRVGGRSEGAG